MGQAPLKQCGKAGCSTTVRGAAYCDQHRTYRHARDDARRGSSRERGYDSEWDRIARRVRQEEPFCRHCLALKRITATALVDHIIAKVDGGTDDRANLQGLCRSCHGLKTAAEVTGRSKV